MPRLRAHCIAMSLDGYAAGPNQSLDNPLGIGGFGLMQWFFLTKTWREMCGEINVPRTASPDAGATEADDEFASRAFKNIGAWIMGRNMFGPVRGPWPDESWKGWWGENPPFHAPVFVLTHHPRAPITMAGGTMFHFVTTGIHDALKQATAAANGQDIRLGGGASTIRQFMHARLLDELHIAISPVLLGSGEPLLANLDATQLGYTCAEHIATRNATHVVLKKAP